MIYDIKKVFLVCIILLTIHTYTHIYTGEVLHGRGKRWYGIFRGHGPLEFVTNVRCIAVGR